MKRLAIVLLPAMQAIAVAPAQACWVCRGAIAQGIFNSGFSMHLVLLALPLLLIVAVVLGLHNLPDEGF